MLLTASFLIVAIGIVGIVSSQSAEARPTLGVVSVTPSTFGHIGGSAVVSFRVNGADMCALSTQRWQGSHFLDRKACGSVGRTMRFDISVPNNRTLEPFKASIRLVVSDSIGTRVAMVFIEVGAAPSFAVGVENRDQVLRIGSNWSGYVLKGSVGTFNAASAEWRVPSIDCTVTPVAQASIWVGVDGDDGADSGLFQVGIQPVCVKGRAIDQGFWSDAASRYLPQFLFSVAAGDLVHAEAVKVGPDVWEYVLDDLTSGKLSEHREHYSGAGRTAEWVVEDPLPAVLADFGRVMFTHLGLVQSAPVWTDPPYSDALALLRKDGTIESIPTPFTGGGSHAGFTVAYEVKLRLPTVSG